LALTLTAAIIAGAGCKRSNRLPPNLPKQNSSTLLAVEASGIHAEIRQNVDLQFNLYCGKEGVDYILYSSAKQEKEATPADPFALVFKIPVEKELADGFSCYTDVIGSNYAAEYAKKLKVDGKKIFFSSTKAQVNKSETDGKLTIALSLHQIYKVLVADSFEVSTTVAFKDEALFNDLVSEDMHYNLELYCPQFGTFSLENRTKDHIKGKATFALSGFTKEQAEEIRTGGIKCETLAVSKKEKTAKAVVFLGRFDAQKAYKVQGDNAITLDAVTLEDQRPDLTASISANGGCAEGMVLDQTKHECVKPQAHQ
jgi:hypothetical protein